MVCAQGKKFKGGVSMNMVRTHRVSLCATHVLTFVVCSSTEPMLSSSVSADFPPERVRAYFCTEALTADQARWAPSVTEWPPASHWA